jgi:hypothetical protein
MNDYASTSDHLTGLEPKKLPSSINVLTILTFIGSGIGIISGIYSFATAKTNYEKLEKMQGSPELENAPDFVKKMSGPEMLEMSRKALENRIPIFIIAMITAGLCIYGALQMRKLQKQGYFIYLIGEILPIITTFIFLGASAFSPFFLFGLIFPVLFIILYGAQLKHMH